MHQQDIIKNQPITYMILRSEGNPAVKIEGGGVSSAIFTYLNFRQILMLSL